MVRERRCAGCGLVSRFADGFEPDWSGWQDDRCPRCARVELSERSRDLSHAEQMEMVERSLRTGMPSRVIAKSVGVPINAVEGKRRWMVKQGELSAPHRPPRKARKPRPGARFEAAVLDDVKLHPGTDRASIVARIDRSGVTVGRCLRRLIAEGKVQMMDKRLGRGGGRRVTYRAT